MATIGAFEVVVPMQLNAFAGEYFCPALGTALHERFLSKELSTEIANYRKFRDALAEQLFARIESLGDMDPSDREEILQEYAREQTPRLVELENAAENFRHALATESMARMKEAIGSSYEALERVDRASGRGASSDEQLLVRLAIYYQDGLLVEQRDLLRELSKEVAGDGTESLPKSFLGIDTFTLFPATFETIRPVAASQTLTQKITRFEAETNELKAELRQLFATRASSRAERTRLTAALAERQKPRFASLQELAEEIRRELVTARAADRNTTLDLPAALVAKIEAKQSATAAFNQEARTAVARRAKIAQIDRTNLNATQQALDEEFLSFAKSRSIDLEAAKTLVYARRARDAWYQNENSRQRKCVLAALEPGLSPEQRRLLFKVGETELVSLGFRIGVVPFDELGL